MRVLLAALFVVAGLAGCIGDDDPEDSGRSILDPALRAPLTEPIYGIKGHYDHSFQGRSETQLYVDFYLPDAPDHHKAATILVFTPYQQLGGGLPEVRAGGGLDTIDAVAPFDDVEVDLEDAVLG